MGRRSVRYKVRGTMVPSLAKAEVTQEFPGDIPQGPDGHKKRAAPRDRPLLHGTTAYATGG